MQESSDWPIRNFPLWISGRLLLLFSFASRINYNTVTKDLDILLMPSPIHNAHHEWIIRTMLILLDSGRLTLAENICLVREVGTSEYACVLFNVLARSMQAKIASREHSQEVIRNPISLTPEFFQYPTLIVESEWSELLTRLRLDKDLWIHGCGGNM